jgi:ribosomal protein S12 methylthiotransferase
VRFAIGESVVAVSLPSFEVVEDGSVVASEELCDAGCAPVLCGESDGEGASSDFWVCVWVVEQLLELRVFVWCQLNEYRCSHVEIIPQRHLQRLGESLQQQFPEVDAWVGVGQMARFAEIVDAARAARQPITDIQPPHHRWADVPTRLRSRAPWTAYLKVSEGCDHQCTFCTIPSFRGKHVSKPIERILEEARWLAHHGAKEINLIAQDTTQYGYDLYKQFMLPTLLRELNAVEGIEWIRIHYAYPSRITDALIEAMAALPKVAHYLDVPLQHADRGVLHAMRRPWDGARYLQMVRRLREAMPDIAIRTTFIVGFPGEDEAAFQQLLDFLKEAQLDRVGAFMYSREKGTPAAQMPNQIPFRIKRERYDRLMRFQQPISLARNRLWVGKTMRVLIEGYTADGKYAIGRSHRDAPDVDGLVYVRNCSAAPGEFVEVRITDADVYDVWGEACEVAASK